MNISYKHKNVRIHWQHCLKFNTAFALVEYSKHIYATDGRILRHSTLPTNTLFFIWSNVWAQWLYYWSVYTKELFDVTIVLWRFLLMTAITALSIHCKDSCEKIKIALMSYLRCAARLWTHPNPYRIVV